MRINFTMHLVNLDDVVEYLGKTTDRDVNVSTVRTALGYFGFLAAPGLYIIQSNEYYSDSGYDAASEVNAFFGAYYDIEDCWLPYKGLYDYDGVNAGEVWNKMFPDTEWPENDNEDY